MTLHVILLFSFIITPQKKRELELLKSSQTSIPWKLKFHDQRTKSPSSNQMKVPNFSYDHEFNKPNPKYLGQNGQLAPAAPRTTYFMNKKLNSSQYDVGFVVPQGVKETELNALEQMLYSFKQRLIQQFVNNFFTTFQSNIYDANNSFPWTDKSDQVRYKLVFDKTGHLVRMECDFAADSKKLNHFFQAVMQEMHAMPNIPKVLYNENNEAEFFYSLHIIQ
jgi:hypothetical protein